GAHQSADDPALYRDRSGDDQARTGRSASTEAMKEKAAMTTETLEARRFRALQQDWSSEDLARFFLLATEDMREARTCRGAANRLGFALDLLLLRLLHCPLPDVNLTPARIIQ